MNILTLSNSPLVSSLGSGRTVLSFTKGLRERGHKVTLLGPEELSLGRGRGALFRLAYGALKEVKRSVDLESLDLIELYGGEFWPVANWAKKRRLRSYIVSHSNGYEIYDMAQRSLYASRDSALRGLATRLRKNLLLKTFKLSDALVFLSKSDASFAKASGLGERRKIEVVPPGLEAPFMNRTLLKDQSHSVGFIGSWSDRKNPKCVVQVFTSLGKEDKSLTFELFGTRMGGDTVKESFPRELQSRIKVHPELNDLELADAISKVKVTISPSWYEGFGLGVAEAMGCGSAVVSTPTGFACEVEEDKEIKIVGFGDTLGMASKSLELLRNDTLRDEIRRAAKDRVQALRWKDSCSALSSLYEEWVAKR